MSAVAWLIERNDLGPPRWLRFGPGHRNTDYTPDANQALRFARQVDAESFILHHECNDPVLRATEHGWVDMPPRKRTPVITADFQDALRAAFDLAIDEEVEHLFDFELFCMRLELACAKADRFGRDWRGAKP